MKSKIQSLVLLFLATALPVWGAAPGQSASTNGAAGSKSAVKTADLFGGKVLAKGKGTALADATTVLIGIPATSEQRFYRITWDTASGAGVNHYLAGDPPYELDRYRQWLSDVSLG